MTIATILEQRGRAAEYVRRTRRDYGRQMKRNASRDAATHRVGHRTAYTSRTDLPICRYFAADFGEQNRSWSGV